MNLNSFSEASELKPHTRLVLAIIAIAVVTRVCTLVFNLPMNFAPITAIALFSGAYFGSAWIACLLPLLSVWFSDHLVNYFYQHNFNPIYAGFYWQYVSYAIIALAGIFLKNRVTPLNVLGASLSSSMLFFFISNFGVWLNSGLYPFTFAGLVNCFVLAIPFFGATMLGDLFYSTLMFGSYEWTTRAERKLGEPVRA